MRLPSVIAVALLAASLSRAADNPPADAPLSDTKRQLQALNRDEAAQKTGTRNDVRIDLPTGTGPGASLDLPLPSPNKEDKDKLKKESQRKNWLLDGYDKLDRKKSDSADPRDKKDGELDEKEKLDPQDPDYFLHVYEKQRAESDAKQREFTRANANNDDSKLAKSDPFAPFMKEWLADSPVRDALKEGQEASNPTTGGESSAHVAVPTESRPAPAVGLLADSSRPTAANPFLQALGLPSTTAKPTEFRAPVAELVARSAFDSPRAPAAVAPLQNERPRDETRNALPPPPDDKKYFPQLKKF